MGSICIDRRILGTPSHLFCSSGSYRWVGEVPDGAWYLSGELKSGPRCLDTLLVLNGASIITRPPEPFVRAMETCMSGSGMTPPWQRVMSKDAHRSFVRAIISQAEESIGRLNREYLEGLWTTGEAVLASLRPAHVDREIWERLHGAGVGNWRVVGTFRPNMIGRCRPVTYNRLGTRTGRLTVTDGPNILTLKREYRNMLRSQWGREGVIAYLDFCNLEARVLLYENGGRCDDKDLYSYINRELFGGEMDRDDIKGAVISELYGQGRYALGKRLGIQSRHLTQFIDRVKLYFGTPKLLARVKSQFTELGYITNRYGRRVEIDEPLDRIFVNSYTQSSAVDVTMLGFWDVIERTRGSRIEPILLLHDAMLLDVHREDLHRLEAIESVRVRGYVQSFPLSLEVLGCTVSDGEVR